MNAAINTFEQNFVNTEHVYQHALALIKCVIQRGMSELYASKDLMLKRNAVQFTRCYAEWRNVPIRLEIYIIENIHWLTN